ncbi:rust resistance kinase Lr10-like [Zingiber officinale]|uniref:non-specific serine/threonine protein kinase n=1 Tax=Zingiber officinale TaxID=94328 RepID=A0A8J5HEP8_ZINOF|nr:rust resistance kinase Lr10-like [Zingiber officinale]KAG6520403.1 hypothetical protein ZIOFF_017453 [Zingiber officinale]
MTVNAVVIFLFFFFRFTQKYASQGTADSYYYEACKPLTCGDVTVAFPFSSSEAVCGLPGFVIACNASSSVATITLSGLPYRVNAIYNYKEDELLLTVSDLELARHILSNSCTAAGGGGLREHFLPWSSFYPFRLGDWYFYLNFTWCDRGQVSPNSINVLADCPGRNNASGSLFLLPPEGPLNNDSELRAGCDHATLPVLQVNLQSEIIVRDNLVVRDNLSAVIDKGFALVSPEWDQNFEACSSCQAAGGRCGYNHSSREPRCFCRETCAGKGDNKVSWKIIVAIVTPTTILLVAGLISFTKFRSSFLSILAKRSSHNSNVKEFISTYKSMLTTEYSYSDLKRIIGGSKEKLGEGGYGNVYKGKLQNGLLVAVKILEKSKDDSQDFINEVATIGQIHHVNVIRLLGFCCDGPHRALVYEFMDKGSLAKLISNEEMRHVAGAQRLLDIALGIARGLEYLHNGCERRILHLDIKPHNVLLDNNFQPKISDFGLAKLQSRKESVVTLTGARGTIGYIAPEVFMRSLGGVSHKSDVYSFGMLLLKMASGKESTESANMQEVGSGSDKYFPDRIYDQLHEWQVLDSGHVEVEENRILRKLVMVGLWCIQANPVSRPSISRAIEMLSGEAEWIEMPPKPLLFSFPDQQQSGHGSQTSYFSIECSSL